MAYHGSWILVHQLVKGELKIKIAAKKMSSVWSCGGRLVILHHARDASADQVSNANLQR